MEKIVQQNLESPKKMYSPQKSPRKRKRTTVPLTDKAAIYFETLDKTITETTNKTHKCKLCQEHFSGIKLHNLVQHIEKRHNDVFETFLEKDKIPAVKRLKLLQHCTEICSINGRPFEYLHDSGFRKIIQSQLDELKAAGHALNLSDHGLTVVKKHLGETARQIRKIIENEVKNRPLSLLVDAVTKRGRSILGVSIQFVLDGQLKIRSIGMIELNQKHTGKYLAELIIKRLDELGIKLFQIMTITTDNAANVLKMVRDMDGILQSEIDKAKPPTDEQNANTERCDSSINEEEDCDSEINNLLAICDITDDDALDSIIEHVNNENLLNAISTELEGAGAVFLFDITGVNCAAHTLQLAINDALAKMPNSFKNIIELCRVVCKVLRQKSCRIEMEQLDIPYKKPRIENATRWGSMFLMVCFLIISLSYCKI